MADPAHWSPAELTNTLLVPDYDGACISNVVPALLEYPPLGDGWMPDGVDQADQVVLLVIDGLGWHQLKARSELAPVLNAASGGPITSIAPTTTAAGLTSICTGTAPGEHGMVGYRIRVAGETLNSLRWTTGRGDARESIPPRELQPMMPFGGRAPVVVNKGDFVGSGFTTAHLDGVDYRPYSTVATLVHEVELAARHEERFIYVYYDGLDRVGHERGHSAAFDAELSFVDRLVSDIRQALPGDAALVVTADHGQVHTGSHLTAIDPSILARCVAISGEDRFLWLHAPGAEHEVYESARDKHGEQGWILTADEAVERGLFGPRVSDAARGRLGDVALIAKGSHGFVDPSARNPKLLARHGSLTAAELHVPLLSVSAPNRLVRQ